MSKQSDVMDKLANKYKLVYDSIYTMDNCMICWNKDSETGNWSTFEKASTLITRVLDDGSIETLSLNLSTTHVEMTNGDKGHYIYQVYCLYNDTNKFEFQTQNTVQANRYAPLAAIKSFEIVDDLGWVL